MIKSITTLLVFTLISFWLIMYYILNVDFLLLKSFKFVFFEVTIYELIIICSLINILFYAIIIYNVINTRDNLISTKLKFIEFTFIGTITLFISYLFLLLISEASDSFNNYTNILFLLYMSIFSFGILLLIFSSKIQSLN